VHRQTPAGTGGVFLIYEGSASQAVRLDGACDFIWDVLRLGDVLLTTCNKIKGNLINSAG
jgi:hypothetical protein